MKVVSKFYDISIEMKFSPLGSPYFYARYMQSMALYQIDPIEGRGSFPPTGDEMVKEWALMHKEELLSNWDLMKEGKSPKKIVPLE